MLMLRYEYDDTTKFDQRDVHVLHGVGFMVVAWL